MFSDFFGRKKCKVSEFFRFIEIRPEFLYNMSHTIGILLCGLPLQFFLRQVLVENTFCLYVQFR